MADLRTTAVNSLPSRTTILAGNLPDNIDEEVLRFHFSVVLDTEVNNVSLLHDKNTDTFRNAAYIDVGSYEKVQRAIREVNGSVLHGKRIMVSLAINPYTSPLEKSIVLKNLPKEYNAMNVYDLLKRYGEIVAIKVAHGDANKMDQNYAFASFVTEEDAQNAIQGVNGRSSTNHRITAEPCQSSVHRDQYISPGKRRVKRSGSQFALDEADTQSSPSSLNISSSSAAPNDLGTNAPEIDYGIAPGLPSPTGDEDYEVAEAAHDLRLQLGIDAITSLHRRKQVIWDHLYPLYAGKYDDQTLKRVLDILFRSLDVETLLEIAVDEDIFHMYAHDAEKIGDGDAPGAVVQPISRKALRLRRQLRWDTIASDEQRLVLLREYLRRRHRDNEHYTGCLDQVLDVLFRSFRTQEILELAADAKQFNMYAHDAMEIIPDETKQVFLLPHAAVALRTKLDLDSFADIGDRKQAIGNYLFRRHVNQYTTRRVLLCRILGALLGSLNVNALLKLAVNPKLFPSYAEEIVTLLHKERVRENPMSESAKILAEQLDLESKASPEEKKETVREHLRSTYENELYLRSDLQEILDILCRSLDVSELLELASGENLFRMYARDAEKALDNKQTMLYPVTLRALELRRQLNWDATADEDGRMERLREYLREEYGAMSALFTMMDSLLPTLREHQEENEMFEIAAAGEDEVFGYLRTYMPMGSQSASDVSFTLLKNKNKENAQERKRVDAA